MCRLKGSKPGGVKKKPVKPAPPAGADAAAALAASAKAGAKAALKWRPPNVILEGTAVPPAEPAAQRARAGCGRRHGVDRRRLGGARARPRGGVARAHGRRDPPAALAPPLSGKEAQSEASLALHGGVNPVLMTDPSRTSSSRVGVHRTWRWRARPSSPRCSGAGGAESKKRTAEEAGLSAGFSFPALIM